MDVVNILTRWGLTVLLLLSTSTQHALASQSNSGKWIIKLRNKESVLTGYQIQNTSERLAFKQNTKKTAGRLVDRHLSKKKNNVVENMGFLITEDLTDEDLKLLATDPDVAFVEKDIIWKTQSGDAGSSSSLPSHNMQNPWLQDVLGFASDSADPYVQSDQSGNVIVAVIDSGTKIDHPFLRPALQGNAAEINGRPGVDDDNNGFIDDTYGANAITRNGSSDESYSSHGTHVSGIVKTVRDHAIQMYPQARKVSILPVRFIGDNGQGSTAAAILALEYAAARGAKVVNASWGAKGFENYSQALYETFARLYQLDIVFTVAAGNADASGPNNNDNIPTFPANYNIPSLISVASVSPYYSYGNVGGYGLQANSISAFSNYGTESVDIAAPGDFINTNGGNGNGILSAYSGYGPWGNPYVRKQGTSMAAPVVAGIAGVIRALNPNLNAYETKQLIISSSRRNSALNGYIRNAGVVHAVTAFQDAFNASNRTQNPGLPGNPVIAGGEEGAKLGGGGGCASVMPVNGNGPGPFGGNSLGLLAFAYAVTVLMKSIRRKKNQRL